jgi:hypothetical protein
MILSRCWARKEMRKTIAAAVWHSSWVILCLLLPYVKHDCPYKFFWIGIQPEDATQ